MQIPNKQEHSLTLFLFDMPGWKLSNKCSQYRKSSKHEKFQPGFFLAQLRCQVNFPVRQFKRHSGWNEVATGNTQYSEHTSRDGEGTQSYPTGHACCRFIVFQWNETGKRRRSRVAIKCLTNKGSSAGNQPCQKESDKCWNSNSGNWKRTTIECLVAAQAFPSGTRH